MNEQKRWDEVTCPKCATELSFQTHTRRRLAEVSTNLQCLSTEFKEFIAEVIEWPGEPDWDDIKHAQEMLRKYGMVDD